MGFLVHNSLLIGARNGKFRTTDNTGGITAQGEGGLVPRLRELKPRIQHIGREGAGNIHCGRMGRVILNQSIGILLYVTVCLGATCHQEDDTGECNQYLFHFDHLFKVYCQDGGFLSLPADLLSCSEG